MVRRDLIRHSLMDTVTEKLGIHCFNMVFVRQNQDKLHMVFTGRLTPGWVLRYFHARRPIPEWFYVKNHLEKP